MNASTDASTAQSLAQNFLMRMKRRERENTEMQSLADFSASQLEKELVGDREKLAFWINLYNAYSLFFLLQEIELISDRPSRYRHFNEGKIVVSGRKLSLNDIEHGLIRNSRIWWSKGWMKKPWVSSFEKRFRVNELDYRIHFVLNCGGASCPPIHYYSVESLEAELKMATRSFMDEESSYDPVTNSVTVSRLLDWYKGDFGGRKGIYRLLERLEIIPPDTKPRIRFADYDWTAKI